jgi:hypothetical protein
VRGSRKGEPSHCGRSWFDRLTTNGGGLFALRQSSARTDFRQSSARTDFRQAQRKRIFDRLSANGFPPVRPEPRAGEAVEGRTPALRPFVVRQAHHERRRVVRTSTGSVRRVRSALPRACGRRSNETCWRHPRLPQPSCDKSYGAPVQGPDKTEARTNDVGKTWRK